MHLIRRDTLAQAISYEIAEQTGQWTSFFQKDAEPIYNFASISAKVKNINDGKFFINTYIENNKLKCTDIYYEDLLGDEMPGIFKIFQCVAPLFKRSSTIIQSSDINDGWKIRFKSDLLAAL
jgi:LPS sulfotransferase NodH